MLNRRFTSNVVSRCLLALALLLAGFSSPASAGTTTFKSNVRVLGTLAVTGATTQTGNFTVGGNLAVTGNTTHTGTLLQSGVATFTLAPVLTTATITASGDTYTIPDVGNASFLMTAGAQTKAGVLTLSAAPVLSTATLTANGDTITIQDLGNANLVQSEGAQTINGVKTFGSAPVITGGLPASQIQTGSAKRQVQTVMLTPSTGAAADATVYRGIISFKRAGTVTGISYGAAVVPTSGTNVIAVEKNSFSGNTMLNAASVSLNSATIGQAATLTATAPDLALTAEQVITCEYNAGTQDTDAEQVFVTVEFEPTDF